MNKRTLSITGIVLGVVLTLSPLWGLLLTVLGMSHAFAILGKAGVSDPRHVALAVGDSLMATTIGIVLCPVGLLVLGLSIFFLTRKTEPVPPPLPEPP